MQILMEAAGLSASEGFHNDKNVSWRGKSKSAGRKRPSGENSQVKKVQNKYKKKYTHSENSLYGLRKKLESEYNLELGVLENYNFKTLIRLQKDLKEIKKQVNTEDIELEISSNAVYKIKTRKKINKKKIICRPSKPEVRPNKVKLGEYDKYCYALLNNCSKINSNLKNIPHNKKSINDLSGSSRTQAYENCGAGVELVIGLDFGTSNTKVVIQETGSRKAWAIPFFGEGLESYLLPSHVYLDKGEYSLIGKSKDCIDNLKSPFIAGQFFDYNLMDVVAFLSLVIRHSREWFLQNASQVFHQCHIDWFYKMGLPAANNDDCSLVRAYNKLLLAAVEISLQEKSAITRNDVSKTIDSDIDKHKLSEYCDVHPEIQAQLGGYVQSDRWDSSRVKVMMIDVGGGTVDASIINVTDQDGEEKYSCLKTKVEPLGVKILHETRLDWLARSAEKSTLSLKELQTEIAEALANSGNVRLCPSSITEYVSLAIWPDEFSIDDVFFRAFHALVQTDIIYDVKKRIDIYNPEQWKSLQLIFCGGGSDHPLYLKITKNPNFDVAILKKPTSLSADVNSSEYHRISVAYGLSFMEQGWFVNASEIEPMIQ